MTKLEKMRDEFIQKQIDDSKKCCESCEKICRDAAVENGYMARTWDAATSYHSEIIQELVKALELIDKRLQIPAAEYVPAIGDVFQDIDTTLESVRGKL